MPSDGKIKAVLSSGRVVRGWVIPGHTDAPCEELIEWVNNPKHNMIWDGDENGLSLTVNDLVLEETILFGPGDLLVPSEWAYVMADRKTWPTRYAPNQWRKDTE